MAKDNENNGLEPINEKETPKTPEDESILITPPEGNEAQKPEKVELCIMCEKNPANKFYGEDYDLCTECRKSLIKTPFSFSGLLAVVALFCVGLWGFSFISGQIETVKHVINGDAALMTNHLYDAVDEYTQGSNVGFKTARKMITIAGRTGLTDILNSAVSTYFYDETTLEEGDKLTAAEKTGKANLNSIWNKNAKQTNDMVNAALDAQQKYYEYISQFDEQLYYGTIEAKEIPYDDLIKKYEAAKAETTAAVELGFINFCEYYLSSICNKDAKTQHKYLVEFAKVAPEYEWVYLTTLTELNVKLGYYADAEENCAAIEAANADDLYSQYFRAQIKRMQGDNQGALNICTPLIADYENNGFYYAYYEAAINSFILGDYEKAKEYNTVCYSGEYLNLTTANLQALLCKLTKDEAGYKEVEELLKGSEIEVSPTVQKFIDGKITAEQMFNKQEVPFE